MDISFPNDPAAGFAFPNINDLRERVRSSQPLASAIDLSMLQSAHSYLVQRVDSLSAAHDIVVVRLNDHERYTSDWIQTNLDVFAEIRTAIDKLKERVDMLTQQLDAPANQPLSFRQLVELHHLKIISSDEVRLRLGFDTDVISILAAADKDTEENLDVLFPPAPPEPDLW